MLIMSHSQIPKSMKREGRENKFKNFKGQIKARKRKKIVTLLETSRISSESEPPASLGSACSARCRSKT